MNFNSYLSLLMIINNKKHLQPSGTFSNGYSKAKIPEKCQEFEKKDLETIVLPENSIVKIEDIRNYFLTNPKTRKVIAYIGTKEDLKTLNKEKFNPTFNNLLSYLKSLDYYENLTDFSIFGNEMEKLFSFNLFSELPSYYSKPEKIFSKNKNYLKTLPFDFSKIKKNELKEKIMVKDFTIFLEAIKENDFCFVEKCIYNEEFVKAFTAHKMFKKFINILDYFNIETKDKLFFLLVERVPFITNNYNLFYEVNYFMLGNILFREDALEKSACLEKIVDLLSEESKINFFNKYSYYFYYEKLDKSVFDNFFKLLEKNILYIPNNSRVKLNIPTFEPIRSPFLLKINEADYCNKNYKFNVSTMSVSIEERDVYDNERIRDIEIGNIDCSEIVFSGNNEVTSLLLNNVFVSSGIIDLSFFHNLKELRIWSSYFIKKIILNENAKNLKVFSEDLDVLSLFDKDKFSKLVYNNKKIK